jgi:hypothetical protein
VKVTSQAPKYAKEIIPPSPGSDVRDVRKSLDAAAAHPAKIGPKSAADTIATALSVRPNAHLKTPPQPIELPTSKMIGAIADSLEGQLRTSTALGLSAVRNGKNQIYDTKTVSPVFVTRLIRPEKKEPLCIIVHHPCRRGA